VVKGRYLRSGALLLAGAVASALGILLLAWMLWISLWAGFANLDVARAVDRGHLAFALEHYGAITLGVLSVWGGSKIAARRRLS